MSFEDGGVGGGGMKSGRDLSQKNGKEGYTLTAAVATEQAGDKSFVAGPIMCLSI